MTASDCTLYEDAPTTAPRGWRGHLGRGSTTFLRREAGEIRAVTDRYIRSFRELMDEPLS